MGRRKKNTVTTPDVDIVKKEAPDVETKIIVDKQPESPEDDNRQNEVVMDDIIMGDVCDDKKILDVKINLFEPSESKTLVINKIINKKPVNNRIGQIKANLIQRPLNSAYKGSRKRPSKGFSLSFKLGHI